MSSNSRVSPSSSRRARWRSASARVTTARCASSSAPSTSAPRPSSLGELLERVAAPGRVDQVGGRPSCRARAAARRTAPRRAAIDFQSCATSGRSPQASVTSASVSASPVSTSPAGVGGEAQRLVAAKLGSCAPRAASRAAPRRAPRSSPSSAAEVGGRDLRAPAPRSARGAARAGPRRPRRPSASSSRRSGSRSSNSRNTSRRPRAVGLAGDRAVEVEVQIGTSRIAVASCFDMRASSAWLVRFSLRLAPEISSMLDEHGLEVAELWSSVGRRLVADAGDAGDVVRGVALEARRSRGSARAGCRSGRSPPRGRRSSCR